MTAIPSAVPAKLPVFDIVLEAFSLWGRNFLYFAPIAAVFVTVLTLFPIVEVPDFVTGITNGETRLLYLGHTALALLLTYALYWLVSWRCFQQLCNSDSKEIGAWFPKEFFRLNPALLMLLIIVEVIYPTIEFYSYDAFLSVFLGFNNSGSILSEYPVVLDVVVQAPSFIFGILFFILMPLTVIEKSSFLNSLKRTFELSRGNYFAIFGLFLLNIVVAAIFGSAIGAVLLLLTTFPGLMDMSDLFFQIFIFFVQWGLMIVFTVALWTATYARLLSSHEARLKQS